MFKFIPEDTLEFLNFIYKRFRSEYRQALGYSAVANILMVVPTLYMLQVYDRVMLSKNEMTLLIISIIALFLLACMSIAEYVRNKILINVGLKIESSLSLVLFNAVFNNKLTYSRAEALNEFNDLAVIKQNLTGPTMHAVLDLPWVPFYILVMFLMHPYLGLMSLLLSLLMLYSGFKSIKTKKGSSDGATQEEFELNTLVHSKLRNIDLIESMGMVPRLKKLWMGRHEKYLLSNAVANVVEYKLHAFTKEISVFKQSLALCVGAILVIDGQLSLGAMIAANLLMGRSTAPVEAIFNSWRNLAKFVESVDRLKDRILEEGVTEDLKSADGLQGEVHVLNVSVSYTQNKQRILDGVQLKIDPGKFVALIGDSGSGKSTLLKAIAGVAKIESGKVLIDGTDSQQYEPTSLGTQVGYVSQDITLFDGTIAENIARMGKVDSDMVLEATKLVGIHDLILRLPQGYDTFFENKSGLLSAGQRQRISLARAVYGFPKILLLDEPDSNLDTGGEEALKALIVEMIKRGTTVVVVTHKDELLGIADQVVRMANAKIELVN